MNFYNFRDYNYINRLVWKTLSKIPEDIDIIVTIPRSGTLIGTMIAEYRKLPLLTIFEAEAELKTKKFNCGSFAPQNINVNLSDSKILLVDDACGFGITIDNAKKELNNKFPKSEILTYSLFVEPYSTNKVDIYGEILSDQFLPFNTLKRAVYYGAFDLDGVICEDIPDPETDDDGERYLSFIKTAKPRFIPHEPIILVTGRLEKYRSVTEEWLHEHHIGVKQLIMCPCNTIEERKRLNPAIYKANVYSNSKLLVFVESNFDEAKIISGISKRPVFCTDIMEMC